MTISCNNFILYIKIGILYLLFSYILLIIYDLNQNQKGMEFSMKKIIFKGAATALATPFTNDEINYNEFKRFIEFQILNKIDALVV